MTKLRLLLAMALAAGFACIGPAWAQDWPSRPVTLVVAFPAAEGFLLMIVARPEGLEPPTFSSED